MRGSSYDPEVAALADSDGAVIYHRLADGLALVANRDGSPSLRRELVALGLDPDDLRAQYPLDLWDACLRRLATDLFPNTPEREAWREVGRRLLLGYFETRVGSALAAVGKLFGAQRALGRLVESFRTSVSYLDVELRPPEGGAIEVVTAMQSRFLPSWAGKELSFPEMRQGALIGALEKLEVPNPRVELVERALDVHRYRYRVRWDGLA